LCCECLIKTGIRQVFYGDKDGNIFRTNVEELVEESSLSKGISKYGSEVHEVKRLLMRHM
jgi:pyrimidine deaminase RibD-like protein